MLNNLKKGSYLKESDITSICDSISAKDFVLYMLYYYIDGETRKHKYVENVANRSNLSTDVIKRLFDFLLKENTLEDLLKLQYDARPQDTPEISILVDGKYQPLHSVSVGQKCNAMLMIALSDGAYPVIIDQPEDSLDIRSIWDDICMRIRSHKVKRQFIFTTHNSSLAVASDTDKYLIIECKDGVGNISNTGVIDTTVIKDDVINYLEGGKPTYINKYQKYGFKLD